MADIYELSDRAVDLWADADPITATASGIAGRDHRWTDLSPVGYEARRDLAAQIIAEAEACNVDGPDEVMAKRVLLDELSTIVAEFDAGVHYLDLNSIASPFQAPREVFDVMATETLDDFSRIIVRLETIQQPIDGIIATLDAGVARGDVVARRQVEAVVNEGRSTAGPNSSLLNLAAALADARIGDDGLRDRLAAAIAHAQQRHADLADWIETEYLPHAPTADGVGADRYVQAARRHLGSTIDPMETYAWGWSELDRLWARLGEICHQIDPDTPIADVIAGLEADVTGAAGSVDEFLALMQERQETALAQLEGSHFDVPEQIRRIAVKAGASGGALAPHYTPPSEDFSRPGTVWYPMGSKTVFPLYSEITTAHHEGFPGHHLQVGVQFARSEMLSRFHRLLVWMPGSGEGWALYAEHLMGELGYLDQPEYEAGLLLAQLMRAARIVIDIGLHLDLDIPDEAAFHAGEHWDFDLAVEMLETRAFVDTEMAESEVTRYLGWPGQAISYKLGERAILDLRTELCDNQGMELKEFHTRVLNVGSIGLDLLRELVLAPA